ncbi:MAG: hypothetical protein QNJ01_04755 [Desulfobacterales bacterium]|nr:hypothetical protein [Desulfobacterales bacterium]
MLKEVDTLSPGIISLIVVAIIVAVYLYAEHKKSGRYFGKGVYLSRKEKQQLAFFKQIYTPITEKIDLPSINKDGYEFEDVALSAREIPYTPPIPEPADIKKLTKDQNVKIVVIDQHGESQRVWVRLTDAQYPVFDGKLLNNPFDIEELEDGTKIRLHSNHILQIES